MNDIIDEIGAELSARIADHHGIRAIGGPSNWIIFGLQEALGVVRKIANDRQVRSLIEAGY